MMTKLKDIKTKEDLLNQWIKNIDKFIEMNTGVWQIKKTLGGTKQNAQKGVVIVPKNRKSRTYRQKYGDKK